MPIPNLTHASKTVADIAMQAEKSLADGYQMKDLFSFIDELSEIPRIIDNKKLIAAEFNNRTPADLQELVTAFENDLTLENKRAERLAEKSAKFLIAGLDLYDEIKNKPIVIPPAA